MPLTPPRSLFRRKFPFLVTGSLLVLGSARLLAAEQFDCQASATGGWDCTPKSSAKPLPPRPHEAATAGAAPGPTAAPGRQEPPATLVTESKGFALASRSPDYSHLDWVPREKLTPAQLAEAAPYCAGAYVEPPRVGMDDDTPMRDAPTYVSARASRYDQEKQIASIAGDVVLRQGSMQVEADEARLHQLENRGEVLGNVKLRDKGFLAVGDRAEIQMDSGEARIENAEYVVHRGHVRGSALTAKREETGIIRLKDGTYTTCEPGSNAWTLMGKNIKLNPAIGRGSATNVTLRVKDLPVFYTPYISFPLDDRRQSGFLAPGFGTSGSSGLTLQTPYYFNLAPNYDATLYPTYMADRGLLLEGEFRYLTKTSEGQVGAAYIDDKEDERELQSDYEDQRWMYHWQHTGGLTSRLMAEVDFTDISDPYYFQDLRTGLGINQPDFLNQRGTLTWRGDTYTARLNVHAFERTSVTDTTPYDRLPQISLDGFLPYQPYGLYFTYGTEYVKFERDLRSGFFIDEDGNADERWYDEFITGLDRAEGDRIHLEPGVSLPLEWTWGYLKPSVKIAHTRYDLSLDRKGKDSLVELDKNGNLVATNQFDDSPDRTVPLYSLDGGLYFDRQVKWFGKGFRQTLEPRMYYLYVPYRDQEDIPVFDTGEHVFSYASLWRDNRFTGKDRIGDANQLSLGMTSRWIEANGFERQRISFGQTFYFQDRRVQMPRVNHERREDSESKVSPYALEYVYRFNHDWRLTSELNWDPDEHHPRSSNVMFHYQPADNPNKIVNLGYRYRNDVMRYNQASGTWEYGTDHGQPGDPNFIKDYYKIDQHDFSTIWPLAPHWSAIARWQYDYSRSRTLEAFGGFEYDSCCWKLRLINRYWIGYDENDLNPEQNDEADKGIFLQVVFKGLGGVVGNKVESFLDQGIEGYREREEQQKAN